MKKNILYMAAAVLLTFSGCGVTGNINETEFETTAPKQEISAAEKSGERSAADIYADMICDMTENGDYGAAGFTLGFADVNSDGIPELIRRNSMRADIEIFDISGNSIWKNAFDPPYEMTLTECKDSETGENVIIYSGYTEHANYKIYTAEAICRSEKMIVNAVYDADSDKLAKLEAAASDDINGGIASADLSETSYSEEEVRNMYGEYFGRYVPVSAENMWDGIKVELSDEMKRSAFECSLRDNYDELKDLIDAALNRPQAERSDDQHDADIISPDADKIAEIFDMRMSEKEWKDGGKLGLSGSASGHAEAYYTDIDCDGEKEFCVLIAGINTSNMYIYGYDKTGEWILKDRLHVTPQYMYFYDDADGERAFISVDSEERHIFSLYSYKKGTTKNIETFSDESCTQEIDYHADAIEKTIESLDNVSDIHDLPHASTDKYYEINVNDDRAALESFADDIGRLNW